MSRKKAVIGNWKMNTSLAEGIDLAQGLAKLSFSEKVLVGIAPPFTHLYAIGEVIADSTICLAAQNAHFAAKGAYTGEISLEMLEDMSVQLVIVGHSERRQYFAENDADLAKKVTAILAANMTPVFCCGEALAVREAGGETKFVINQLEAGLGHLSPYDLARVIIAYEPIWAIGTGVTASTEQAQAMHADIRAWLHTRTDLAENILILYGGSCNAQNAAELFAQADVDGGLIGGASLKIADFTAIINAAGAAI